MAAGHFEGDAGEDGLSRLIGEVHVTELDARLGARDAERRRHRRFLRPHQTSQLCLLACDGHTLVSNQIRSHWVTHFIPKK